VNKTSIVALMLAVVAAPAFAQEGAKAIFEGHTGTLTTVSTSTSAGASDTTVVVQTVVSAQPPTAPTAKPTHTQRARSEAKPVAAVTKPQSQPPLALKAWVQLVDATGGTKDVSPSRTFLANERIRLAVRTNRPGYLYVANIGSSGVPTVIFPKAGQSNAVAPGLSYTVPDKATLRFDALPGTETLLVVLSPQPLEQVNLPDGMHVATNTQIEPRAQVMAMLDAAQGSKDLMVEEDGQALYAVPAKSVQAAPGGQAKPEPVIVKLPLKHGI
jgi:hypothetical protein